MATRRTLPHQIVNGFIIPESFSSECFTEALQYKPTPDDLFIVTFPKCGTTWVQAIVLNIFRKGKNFETFEEFHAATPYLEMAGVETVDTMKRPGAIKTHLPFRLQPYSPHAKYIYVTRNPKDCCVSYYHHLVNLEPEIMHNINFDDFFEIFVHGETNYGDYFEHVSSWLEHRDDPNILFLTYEQLKKNTRAIIMKIARFMGEEYKNLLEKEPSLMETILNQTSFTSMKEAINPAMSLLLIERTDEEIDELPIPKGLKHILKFKNSLEIKSEPKAEFIRKGVVGDWRSHFSEEQSKRMDERFNKIFGHTELYDLWKKDMEL